MVLSGTVVSASLPIVKVEIDQTGREHTLYRRGWWGPSYYTVWSEVGRRTEANPFSLRLASGEVISVEPDPGFSFIDKLDRLVVRSGEERTRIGEVTHDQVVHLSGQIEERFAAGGADYRESAPKEFVLRHPSGGHLLIATEPLSVRYRQRFRFHMEWFLYLSATMFAVHMVFLASFHRRVFEGRVVQATVLEKSIEHHSKYSSHWVYAANEGQVLRDDATVSCFSKTRVGDSTPFLVIPAGGPFSEPQIGARAALDSASAAGSFFLTGLMISTYLFHRQRSRPRYEKQPLVEFEDGRLEAI